MDFISHVLIGRILAFYKDYSRKSIALIILFSIMADIPQIFLYAYLGYLKLRLLWIPLNVDWVGFRDASWAVTFLWEIPHSFIFLFVVVLPIVIYFKLPRIAFVAYFSHLFLDLFTHTGEWAVKPLFPLGYTFPGFADVWAWSVYSLMFLWLTLTLVILILQRYLRRKKKKV